jgi:hypothetical protein
VKFRLSSHHEDGNENPVETIEEEREVKDLDELFEITNNETDWGDSCVCNLDAESYCFNTNRDLIEVRDSKNKILYKDEDEQLIL